MSNKSYYVYNKVFQEILNLLEEYSLEVNFKDKIITCDFEKSLLKAIRINFKGIRIYGCYFHYVKALWKKARKLGLTKTKIINKIKLLYLLLKFIHLY